MLCRLRVSEIHHFVEELINNDKVITNGFLLELLEVLGEDGDEFVKKQEDSCGVGVAFGHGDH